MIGRTCAAALGLLVLLAGCTVGPSQRPPVAVRGIEAPAAPAAPPTPTPEVVPPLQPQATSLPFVDCTADALDATGVVVPPDRRLRVECGELIVPIDPARADLGSALLGVVRVGTAGAPLERPPLLVLGDSVVEPSVRHAVELASRVSPALLERFTVIGMDRRGSGVDRLDCAPPDARAALLDADPAATTEADLAALLEQARAVVQECNLALAAALGGFGADATAVDVEALRSRLGVPRLSAIGSGDGAAALEVWARAAPGGVGRLVLDAPPDLSAAPPESAAERAQAGGAAIDAFALACTAPGTCPLGPDPRGAVTALVEALRAQPLAAPDGRRLTAGSATNALILGLSEPRDWPGLAAALAAARTGDPVPLLATLDPFTGPDARLDGALASGCNDHPARLSPPEIGELAARLRADQPLTGGTAALRLLACAPWPALTGGGPAGELAGSLPPMLVLGTAADPRAPEAESRRVADRLPSARYLRWEGAGTGAYPRTPCVTDAVDALLLDATVPGPGVLCPP